MLTRLHAAVAAETVRPTVKVSSSSTISSSTVGTVKRTVSPDAPANETDFASAVRNVTFGKARAAFAREGWMR